MGVQDLGNLFGFVGGVGMFLYGMQIMGDGMQKTAGKKMSSLLGKLTSNRILAILVGALVTAIIQSSGATTVMVVGFVNAGIMNLSQAIGVIMGANIGTTITSWIVSMSALGDAVSILKPSFLAPVLIGIGAFITLFTKSDRKRIVGEILVGLGLLFIGLDFMTDSASAYTDMPIFAKAFATLGNNPILGVIVGAVVTAILQSSSASVGIVQSLAMNGVVTVNAAVFLTLGQNIGSCVTALISCAGANRTAKRAAIMHLLFNVVGAVVFGLVAFVYFTFFNQVFAQSSISSVQNSIFHSMFNITNTLLLVPFANLLVKMSGLIVREKPGDEEEDTNRVENIRKHLDARLLEAPSVAFDAVRNEVVEMGQLAIENTARAVSAAVLGDTGKIERVHKNEITINEIEHLLSDYLVQLSNLSLTNEQHVVLKNLFYVISDVERVGDHAKNIAELAEYRVKNGIEFTEGGAQDLQEMSQTAVMALERAVAALKNDNVNLAREAQALEDRVDTMEKKLREEHIERLAKGLCNSSSGVVFLDIVSNLERVSDHADNIAGYVVESN